MIKTAIKAAFALLYNNALSIVAISSVIMTLVAASGVQTSPADQKESCTLVTTPINDTTYSFLCVISELNSNMP
jgi:hypothetical protein